MSVTEYAAGREYRIREKGLMKAEYYTVELWGLGPAAPRLTLLQ